MIYDFQFPIADCRFNCGFLIADLAAKKRLLTKDKNWGIVNHGLHPTSLDFADFHGFFV